MTFYTENVLTNKKNEFCGVRLLNPVGVILDLEREVAFRIFPFLKEVKKKRNPSIKEFVELFNVNNMYKYAITGINSMFITPSKKEVGIIDIDEEVGGTYLTIKSSAIYTFTLRYPLNAYNLLSKTNSILSYADNLVRMKIQTAFNLNRVFLAEISKDGIVKYSITPRKKDEFKEILTGCQELSEIFNFKVSEGETQVGRNEYEKCIFLTFEKPIGIVNSKPSKYFTNGTSLFVEESTGFLYNMGTLIDSMDVSPMGLNGEFLSSTINYTPVNRLYQAKDRIFYIIYGTSYLYNEEDEYPLEVFDLKDRIESLPVLNALKNGEIKYFIQRSYRNIITTFRIPVDYTEFYTDPKTMKTMLLEEFCLAELSNDWNSVILDAKINTTEKEVWFFVTLQILDS